MTNLSFKSDKDSLFVRESLLQIYLDSLKYAPSKIVGTIINFLLVPLYTNLLNPEGYGLYMLATGALSFLCIIFSDWVGLVSLRFFREHYNKDDIRTFFSSIMFLLFTNLLIMYVLGFLLFKPLKEFFNISGDFQYLVFLLIIPVALRALFFQFLRAQIKPLSYTFSVIINQLLTVGIASWLILQFDLGVTGIIIAMAVSISLIDVVMLFQSDICCTFRKSEVKKFVLSGFYKYGLPISLASIGMWGITQSNRFVLQHLKGSVYNGFLGVGYNLTFSFLLPLCSIITLAAVPRIINKFEEGKNVSPLISKLSAYYFMLFSPFVFLFCIYSKEIVSIFANSKFIDAYVLVPYLALSAFFIGLADYTTIQYHLSKKTYLDTIIKIVSGLLGIGMSIVLIGKMGLLGVGIATLVSNFAYFLLSITVNVDKFNWVVPWEDISMVSISLIGSFFFSQIIKSVVRVDNLFTLMINLALVMFIYVFLIRKGNLKFKF